MGNRMKSMASQFALALLDVLQPPVPPRVARWMPWFMLATRREREIGAMLRNRLERR